MEKKNVKKDIQKLSYAQLEEESAIVLKTLQEQDLPLDESKALYDYGKRLYDEMARRLDALLKETNDEEEAS